jgi:predicted acetyltransferase
MPELIVPTVTVHASFVDAMAELTARGYGRPDDDSTTGHQIREWGSRWQRPDEFRRYLRSLRDAETEAHARRAGKVPETTLWWVSGDHYLGRIHIRHRLSEQLREYGGHIGYDVRPSARRQGHATAMLAAALPVARELGIDPALLMCDEGNLGSRKVIEGNGGIREDCKDGRLRYWVPTS